MIESDRMAQIIKAGDSTELRLPGRISREIVSGANGSRAVTLRRVAIPVEPEGGPGREPHAHPDAEECIHVIAGRGAFCTKDGERPVAPGDTVLIPPGEFHYTRNAGAEPLELLGFFPVADLAKTER